MVRTSIAALGEAELDLSADMDGKKIKTIVGMINHDDLCKTLDNQL